MLLKNTLLVLSIALSLDIVAQIPLNKRDQQRKAEFEAQIAAEEKYDAIRVEADKAFVDKDYVQARMKFQEAIQYSPENEQWLTSKVNDLDILMAKNIAREVDSVMVIRPQELVPIEVAKAEPSPIAERSEPVVQPEAPIKEEKQEDLPPPPPPVEEVVELVKPEAKPASKPEIAPAPKPVEKQNPIVKPLAPLPAIKEEKELKVKEDFGKYPQGMTDETFEFPDHTVRRIVVKDGIDTIVYKYVTHRWGGKYYFKDDVSIVERIWKEEVEAFQQKYPAK